MQPFDLSANPPTWWKLDYNTFSLLAKYYKANSGFQATSLASERIYNVDKLVGILHLMFRVVTFSNLRFMMKEERVLMSRGEAGLLLLKTT